MQESLARGLRITTAAVLSCVLVACSALRMGYDQGPQLVWWWLDGYADFDSSQAPAVKDAVHRWFSWHRTTQLADYAAWLAGLRSKVGESITPAQVCRWNEEVRARLTPAAEQAFVLAVPLVHRLTEAQFRHIGQRHLKNNEEFRREHLQADAAERREAALERAVERAESVYGRIDERQRALLADAVAASPYDPEAALGERQRRQRDTLQTLRRLAEEKPDAAASLAALRSLAERMLQSPRPEYRAYQQRITDYNCAVTARLHATTSAEQRRAARERIAGWENDLRLLATAAP